MCVTGLKLWFMTYECLVGGDLTILKNDGVRQWEGWHPIYEMENKIHVWNHRPDIDVIGLKLWFTNIHAYPLVNYQ